MVLPRWLVFVLAAWVVVFGVYRLWVAFRREESDGKTSHWRQVSVFGRTKRAHAIYGVAYLLLGGMLLATGFGVQMPFAAGCQSMFDRQQEAAPGAAQPSTGDGRNLQLERAPGPE